MQMEKDLTTGSVIFSTKRGSKRSDGSENQYFTAAVIGAIILSVLACGGVRSFERPIYVRNSFYSIPDPAFQQYISIYAEQHKLLREMAEKLDCIIVGRCVDYILRDLQPFRIFVHANTASKLTVPEVADRPAGSPYSAP